MNSIADFRTLFESYFTPLVKYSYRITGDKEVSKDLVQTFFVTFWKQYGMDKIENFESFAFTSIKNKSLNTVRFQKKFVGSMPNQTADGKSMDMIEKDIPKHLLEVAIRRLPDKCREVFMLSKIDGLTYTEISEVLEISIKTVERQIGIGLAKLRAELEPHREYFLEYLNE